jgi:short-subunit dehydrogenase
LFIIFEQNVVKKMSKQFQNPSTILITGASSGLGKALALHYAKEGVNLCLTGRDEARLRDISQSCIEKGAYVKASCVDVTDKMRMAAWINDCDASFEIDLVIANAGISGGTSGANGENSQQVRKIFATNVDGVFNTIMPAIHKMQGRGKGQIAIISSLAGLRGMPSCPAYSASKAAVKAYGEGLRGQLISENIGVSVVCPGYIKTPLSDVNTFPMPFLMSAEKAAKHIAKKLKKNRSRIAFPWPLYWVLNLCGFLTPKFTDLIFNSLPKK